MPLRVVTAGAVVYGDVAVRARGSATRVLEMGYQRLFQLLDSLLQLKTRDRHSRVRDVAWRFRDRFEALKPPVQRLQAGVDAAEVARLGS